VLPVVTIFETAVASLSSDNDSLELIYVKRFYLVGYLMMHSVLRLCSIG
jgi:hypothetical protein